MTDVRHPDAEDIAAWEEYDGAPQHVRVIGGPDEGDDVAPCPALVSEAGRVHVPHMLNEIELAQLATGGTLWLTTWGGLPVHSLVVVGGRQA